MSERKKKEDKEICLYRINDKDVCLRIEIVCEWVRDIEGEKEVCV